MPVCRLGRVNYARIASEPSSCLGHSRTAQCQALRPTPRAWALGFSPKGSWRRNQLRTSDLHGRVFHMGLDSIQCDVSFPLNLIQVGSPFFLVDHSCPDVATYFYVFCREVFFFSFIFRIFATKRTHLNSVSPLDCDLPVLTVKSLVS